jgi:hypothetical protein
MCHVCCTVVGYRLPDKLLLALASTAVHGFESCGTHDVPPLRTESDAPRHDTVYTVHYFPVVNFGFGARGSAVVTALCYKPEGREF